MKPIRFTLKLRRALYRAFYALAVAMVAVGAFTCPIHYLYREQVGDIAAICGVASVAASLVLVVCAECFYADGVAVR